MVSGAEQSEATMHLLIIEDFERFSGLGGLHTILA
jgi:hypothetical protein